METVKYNGFDLNGRAYAKVSDVVKGSIIEADNGFTCISKGDKLVVDQDDRGLFIPCEDGHHYLDGQIEGDDDVPPFYMGLYPQPDPDLTQAQYANSDTEGLQQGPSGSIDMGTIVNEFGSFDVIAVPLNEHENSEVK